MHRTSGESDEKESLYVSRNELYASDRGLRTARANTKPYSRSSSRTTRNDSSYSHGRRIAEKDFLSHVEFPDVQTAVALTSEEQVVKTNDRQGNMNRNSTNRVAKFKPFDPNRAPSNFQKKDINVNSQYISTFNSQFAETSNYHSRNVQPMYQFIPPPPFEHIQNHQQVYTLFQPPVSPSGPSATAVAPNGEKIYIPLDDSRYEIKRDNHDLYEMPEDCKLRPLSPECQFESSVNVQHSPRPVDTRGSLSDDWSSSSDDGRGTETESEHENETTETDESELASNYVAAALKKITESVDNLAVGEGNESSGIEKAKCFTDMEREKEFTKEDDIEPTENATETLIKNVHIAKALTNNGVLGETENTSNVIESKARDEQELVVTNSNDKIHVKEIASSSSDIIVKRGKNETTQNDHGEHSEAPGEMVVDAKINKRPKSTKPQTWRQNRKERHDKTRNKQRVNEKGTECTGDEINKPKDSQIIHKVDHDTSTKNSDRKHDEQYPTCIGTGSVQHTPEANSNVILDGQDYFQPSQLHSEEYQPYYVPDNYTFEQTQYQSPFGETMVPAYTMFIHDACPPPRQDEGYNQVHKSLSGEIINLTGPPDYQGQYQLGASEQQQYRVSGGKDTTEGVISNTESHQPNTDTQQTEANPVQYSQQHYLDYNQFFSGSVTEQIEHHPQDQGKLFVCYDEESVYVDPESGLSYPAIHMTEDHLITVILREGVFLEITANKALRLVNHEKKLVVAMNETGNRICVIHPAARIYQSDLSVHAELYSGRRAKMTNELVMFGNKLKTYKFDDRRAVEMTEEPVFRDLSHDDSVDFLATDFEVGSEEMNNKMNEILARAHFWKSGVRGCTVIINGTKIVQNEKGEVSVYCGPIRFLRMNPEKMILRLKTLNIEVDIETNWNVKVTRGSNALNVSHIGFIVSNGKIKACLDSDNRFHSFSLPDHKVLMLGQPIPQHRPGVPGRQRRRTPSRKIEPEGDHWDYATRSPESQLYNFSLDWNVARDYNYDHRDYNYRRRWDPQAGRWVYPTMPWHSQERR